MFTESPYKSRSPSYLSQCVDRKIPPRWRAYCCSTPGSFRKFSNISFVLIHFISIPNHIYQLNKNPPDKGRNYFIPKEIN